jgi:hypothetical protein
VKVDVVVIMYVWREVKNFGWRQGEWSNENQKGFDDDDDDDDSPMDGWIEEKSCIGSGRKMSAGGAFHPTPQMRQANRQTKVKNAPARFAAAPIGRQLSVG